MIIRLICSILVAVACSATHARGTMDAVKLGSEYWPAWKRIADAGGTGTYDDAVRAARFMGYVEGALDAAIFDKNFCFELEGKPLPAVARTIGIHVENHPQDWHKSAYLMVLRALTNAYPCRN